MKSLILATFALVMIGGVNSPKAYAGGAGDFLKIIGGLIGSGHHGRGIGRGGRHRGGRWGGGSGYRCVARDNGYEEHWGGHRDCRSCLQKHGNCTETCYDEYYVCTASGTDRNGVSRDFQSDGRDRWDAQDRAERRCRRAGYNNCFSRTCDSQDEVVSRRGC